MSLAADALENRKNQQCLRIQGNETKCHGMTSVTDILVSTSKEDVTLY